MRIVTLNGQVQCEGPNSDFVMKDGKPYFDYTQFNTARPEVIQLWETGDDVSVHPAPNAPNPEEGQVVLFIPERHEKWRVAPSPKYLESLEPDELPSLRLHQDDCVLVPVEDK
jgi:hypothetical protein